MVNPYAIVAVYKPMNKGTQWDIPVCYWQFVNQTPTDTWDYWEPHLFVENGLGGVVEKATYQVLFDQHGTAMVEERRSVRGNFKSALDLYDYPFDVQVRFEV